MSVFHDKFNDECKHFAQINAYHIEVYGEPLVHKDKGELEKMFERALVAGIAGWVIIGDDEDSGLRAIPKGHMAPEGYVTYGSFIKAKAALTLFLNTQAGLYRKAAVAARSAKKLDTLAGSL